MVTGGDRPSELSGLYVERQDAFVTRYGSLEPGSKQVEWLEWATRHADRADPLVESPPSILDEKSKWNYGYGYW